MADLCARAVPTGIGPQRVASAETEDFYNLSGGHTNPNLPIESPIRIQGPVGIGGKHPSQQVLESPGVHLGYLAKGVQFLHLSNEYSPVAIGQNRSENPRSYQTCSCERPCQCQREASSVHRGQFHLGGSRLARKSATS